MSRHLVRASQAIRNFSRSYQTAGRLLETSRSLARKSLNAPKSAPLHLNAAAINLTGLNVLRNYHKSVYNCFYNSPGLRQDPCCGNNNQQQEEEEECTITPCCRPFRLQKEHPMKKGNQNKDKCADQGKSAPAKDRKG